MIGISFKSIGRVIFPRNNSLKRLYGTTAMTPKELRTALTRAFPKAKGIMVEDVSGGSGAIFEICVESSDFQGLSIVKQHQAVTDALKEEIKRFHGVRIKTKVAAL